MNFIFISPQFPKTYWNFCDRLKRRGVNVLGIGDTPYDMLSEEVKNSLHEYYYVASLEKYEDVLRAVGFFTFKYGKIDWIESNNEYWLKQDARLRTDFNVTTGYQNQNIDGIKCKSNMKAFYEKANVKTARWHLVTDIENGKNFIEKVGYPVIVKPDTGVGAAATYKIKNEEELHDFYDKDLLVPYIMEECIEGEIWSYDGIVNSKKEIIFETCHIFPTPIMEIVNQGKEMSYYSVRTIPEEIKAVGERTIASFDIQSRFFHFEFFKMSKDKEGLGNKGDMIGLEVNMRPPGGYTPDMMNFSANVDVYQLWADMIIYDKLLEPLEEKPYYCVFASRRDEKQYLYTHEEILNTYKDSLRMQERMPEIMSDAMGNQMYTACFKTKEEVDKFITFVQKEGVL